MFSLLIAHQLARLRALCVMLLRFPEQVFGWMRGSIKKKILEGYFESHEGNTFSSKVDACRSGDPVCFLSLPSWWGQEKGHAVHIGQGAFPPSLLSLLFFLLLTFLLTDSNSLSHFLDFERVIKCGPTELVTVVSFVVFFLALRKQLINRFFFFFLDWAYILSIWGGKTLTVVTDDLSPPPLEAVCPWNFFEGR